MKYGNWETIKDLGQGGQGKVFLAHDIRKYNIDTVSGDIVKLIKQLSAMASTPQSIDSYRKDLIDKLLQIYNYNDVQHIGALKTLNDSANARDYSHQLPRMKREIEALSSIAHANVASIIEANIEEHWFVSKYYSKGNLSDNKKVFQGNIMKSLISFKTLVEGVSELHKKGLIHRDIKPENIYVSENEELILGDFGLVFFSDENHTRISETYENVGSRDWMPAWAMGMKIDDIKPSFDIFSLGKILWYMISRKPKMRLWYFNETEFNLEVQYPKDTMMIWINKILQLCVVEKENNCLSKVEDLIEIVNTTIPKIQMYADLTSQNRGRICHVCGEGQYQEIANPNLPASIRNLGLQPAGTATYKILWCSHCGHTQLFLFRSKDNTPPLWH